MDTPFWPNNEALLALSIRQPYAELILRGIKTVEYRSKRRHGRYLKAGRALIAWLRGRPATGRPLKHLLIFRQMFLHQRDIFRRNIFLHLIQ